MLARSAKPVSIEDFERTQKPVRQSKNQLIKDGTHHIAHLMKESNNVLKMSTGHPDWKSYVDFINDIVGQYVAFIVTAMSNFRSIRKIKTIHNKNTVFLKFYCAASEVY